jgi:hypothetical protein
MTGEMEAADRLLSWADELVEKNGVLLPELRVVRAITRIERAAPIAPWQEELALPVGIDQLHCTPLHPGHSGLWKEPQQGVRGEIGNGRRLLKEALALLDEAEARGATPFTIAAARTCANLYLADAAGAAAQQARTESLLPRSAPSAVKRVLAENRALVSFLGFARKKPAPGIDDIKALRAWTDELARAVGGAGAPAGLSSVITALRDPGAAPPTPARDAPACTKPPSKPAAVFAALPTPAAAGACPQGFRLTHTLPSAADTKAQPRSDAITVCRTPQDDADLVTVHLTPTTTPASRGLDRTMRFAPPPAELGELAAWACQCASLKRQGVSDRGEVVYRAQCPALGLDQGVVVVANGHVEHVIQHSR